MISIVVCSRNKSLPELLKKNIEETIKVEYEIIHINNSDNKLSICAAYNKGSAKSKYPYLCFVHEDVLFHSQNWGEKLIAHLQQPNAGVLGFAGRDLLTRVPASWSVTMPSVNLVQSDKTGHKRTKNRYEPAGYKYNRRSVIMLDGVFLCMKRSVTEKIKFDENLSGFHGYDFDISIQSILAGYTNYVMYDIKLEHFSRGTPDIFYYRNLIKVFKKWEKNLPLIGENYNVDLYYKIPTIEKKGISKLTNKMIRRGFPINEIITEKKHFTNLIGIKKSSFNSIFIHLNMLFVRIVNFPKYIFSK